MKQAWSLFWLVVAICVAGSIVASFIQPYLGIIALLIVVVLAAVIAVPIWRYTNSRRGHL